MPYAGRNVFTALALVVAALTTSAGTLAPVSRAQAQGLFDQPKYAAIVVDANTGEVLYAKRADALRYPASITKVMTLYLTFEALATGRLSLGERISVSAHAASMAPSKTKLRPGDTLTVDEAIRTVAIHSANDIAVALSERIGGSEGRFGQLMTLRAQELGMANSRFVNASGLPDARQVTSARDIALLSRAVMRDYPQYYSYFGQTSYDFHGELFTNHNHLMQKMPGMDGLKTGFTNAAGFNLAASAVRGGRRLITVVLGGPSTAARDENVEELLNAGFAVLDQRSRGSRITLASAINEPDEDMAGPIQRAPIEQGSGEQPDLKVVVQPQIRTLPTMAAARALSPKLSAPPIEPTHLVAETPKPELTPASSSPTDATLASAIVPEAAAPCAPTRRRRHGPTAACNAQTAATTKLSRQHPERKSAAEATLAAVPPCPTRGRRRHGALGCDHEAAGVDATQLASAKRHGRAAGDDDASAEASAKDVGGGGYMIQVGAYKNAGQAKDHLGQVAEGYGGIVGSASARVEKSGGNYRVRFRGLSEKSAKAACHALSAKGQPCMVMDAS